jgi:demethylmenaquinone methyltransferase/2-methoxy-6-polyprenyl-1,4-benzoquinol methylase
MGTQPKEQAAWLATGEQKGKAVREIFSEIAPHYDQVNSIMSLRQHGNWRRMAVEMLNLKPTDRVCDVCCGTGDFFEPLLSHVQSPKQICGVDFCTPMLTLSQKKFGSVPVILGDACTLPLASSSIDAVTVGWGIRNVPDIGLAFSEIKRILKPGGRLVFIDCAVPDNKFIASMSTFFTLRVLPFIGARFGTRSALEYLPQSTLKFSTRSELRALLTETGFEQIKFKNLMFGNIAITYGVAK